MESGFEDPVNLGNPNENTVNELANLVKELVCSDSEIIYKKLPEDDPKKRCPDISRASKILGWQPISNLREGLIHTIEWLSNLERLK